MCHPVEPSGSLKYIVCFSVVILLKPGMRNAFNMLLVSLSTMDNFWIILAIGDYSITRWVKYALVGKSPGDAVSHSTSHFLPDHHLLRRKGKGDR